MGRAPCCSKVGLHRGPWTPREDTLLTKGIQAHGEGHWKSLPKKAGLLRCGKSCRLRWMNYLRPDIKRGNVTPDEDDLIIRMHSLLGNRWSLIAGRLPGRTDNEIKNYWNSHLSKRLRSQGTDPNTHKKLSEQPVPEREVKTKRRRNNRSANKISMSNNNKKNQNKRKAKLLLEPEKPKVYLPKPVRFTCLSLPRNDDSFAGFNKNNSLSPSSQQGREDQGCLTCTAEEVVDVPWCNFTDGDDYGVGFLVGEVDHDHGLGVVNNGSPSDLDCSSPLLPTTDSSLEKLYEEYLQLLKTDDQDQVQLDSFTESWLV